MTITFDKKELTAALSPAMSAVCDKNTLTAIEGVLFEVVEPSLCRLSTYDLERGFKISLPCHADEVGSFIVGAQRLLGVVRSMPESEITIEEGSRASLRIRSGKSEFSLPFLPGEEFPSLPELTGERSFTLPSGLLRAAINEVKHAMAQNDTARPILNGTYFRVREGKLTTVACDSYRLALREKEGDIAAEGLPEGEEVLFIVPGKTLTELLRLLPGDEESVTMELSRKFVVFRFGEKLFFSRLIDGEYLRYEQLLPKNNSIRVHINREDFISSLSRAALVAEDKPAGKKASFVRCLFEGNRLTLSTETALASSRDELPVQKEGGDIRIGFDTQYLLDALRTIADEQVLMTLSGPLLSATIEGDPTDPADRYLYMISPVKLKD